MVTPTAARRATGRDGIDQPVQDASIDTPKGRGRRTAAERAIASQAVSSTETSPTITWR